MAVVPTKATAPTEGAVRSFQQEKGLMVDGMAGSQTQQDRQGGRPAGLSPTGPGRPRPVRVGAAQWGPRRRRTRHGSPPFAGTPRPRRGHRVIGPVSGAGGPHSGLPGAGVLDTV